MALDKIKAKETAARLAGPASAQAKTVANGVSTALDHNAKSQAINNRGSLEPSVKSSIMFNPKNTQQNEKKDTLQAFFMRSRAVIQLLGEVLIPQDIWVGVLPKLALHTATLNPLVLVKAVPDMALNANAIKSISGKALKALGTSRVLLKDIYTKGFRIERLAEPEAKQAKAFLNRAETCIVNEAGGVVANIGTVVQNTGDMIVTQGNLVTTFANQEVKRIANLYGIEADYLMAMIQTAILLKGADIQIDSTVGDVTINAFKNINIKANGLVKIEGLLGVEVASGVNTKIRSALATDVSGTSVSVQAATDLKLHGVGTALLASTGVAAVTGAMGCLPWGGIPVPPFRPDLIFPPVTTPVVPIPVAGLIVPQADYREPQMLQQTSGMLTMPGTVL